MILLLSKITEVVIENKETKEKGPQLVYEFGLDQNIPLNNGYSAVVLQLITKEKLSQYNVGEHYSFASTLFIPEKQEEE